MAPCWTWIMHSVHTLEWLRLSNGWMNIVYGVHWKRTRVFWQLVCRRHFRQTDTDSPVPVWQHHYWRAARLLTTVVTSTTVKQTQNTRDSPFLSKIIWVSFPFSCSVLRPVVVVVVVHHLSSFFSSVFLGVSSHFDMILLPSETHTHTHTLTANECTVFSPTVALVDYPFWEPVCAAHGEWSRWRPSDNHYHLSIITISWEIQTEKS